MRICADAHRLPLASASVDLVVGHPPYPGNGIWKDSWRRGVDQAMAECRRVLRPGGIGWFMLRDRHGSDRWLWFNSETLAWAHVGSWSFPVPDRVGTHWGVIPDNQLAPLIMSHSESGDRVLDPFAGRGCIPKMAARLGRIPIGVDIDPIQLNGGRY